LLLRAAMKVVTDFMRARVALTHAQRVTRLYRTALRTLDSWACDREIFLTRGGAIRARFDAAKGEAADGGCGRARAGGRGAARRGRAR